MHCDKITRLEWIGGYIEIFLCQIWATSTLRLSGPDENLLLESDFRAATKWFIKNYQAELGTHKYREALEHNISVGHM